MKPTKEQKRRRRACNAAIDIKKRALGKHTCWDIQAKCLDIAIIEAYELAMKDFDLL